MLQLPRGCGWGVEDDRESEGEKGCVVQGLWVGVDDDRESEGEKGCVVQGLWVGSGG